MMSKLPSYIFLFLLIASGIAVAMEDESDQNITAAKGCMMKPSPRKLLIHSQVSGENCTQSNQDLGLEIGAEEDGATGLISPKVSSRKMPLLFYKMLGIRDDHDHGQNCAILNQSCVFDACCSGCECLGFMLWCVGDC
ncbi:OLC1v1008173C1 [Oldenlandia corymbosa var. corymbosa]|uniref:OLC1v1008173C1 n=1 Tax=Oldenlandia corymbosa var. corymbosa TaxID=529605 RepID=A0AAV1DL54_OLDCO|nr:OLC1v1008173C1 [Oldenlandia corymbosa var. corymbosa]